MFRALLLSLAVLALAEPALGGGGASPFFASTCRFGHMAPDDPIVSPRKPGFSHDHTFVGNVSTSAFSTLATLRRAATTCDPVADTAAYWAPTLFVDGKPLAPAGATIYYRRLTTAPPHAFPAGLRMVAGDPRAWRAQSTAVTFWDCGVIKTTFYGANLRPGATPVSPAASSSIPSCPVTTRLELHVNFPQCWDGTHLDSANHKSHMAYAIAGRCPAGHPIAVPAISLVYRYPAEIVDAAGTVILSSGGQHSGHADFINSWQERALTKLVERCLNAYAYCGAG